MAETKDIQLVSLNTAPVDQSKEVVPRSPSVRPAQFQVIQRVSDSDFDQAAKALEKVEAAAEEFRKFGIDPIDSVMDALIRSTSREYTVTEVVTSEPLKLPDDSNLTGESLVSDSQIIFYERVDESEITKLPLLQPSEDPITALAMQDRQVVVWEESGEGVIVKAVIKQPESASKKLSDFQENFFLEQKKAA